jgi:hypothetical protein
MVLVIKVMVVFNTNVGDMPLDIFSDYISDTLGEEWSWEYLSVALNWAPEEPEGIPLYLEMGDSNGDSPDYFYGGGDGYCFCDPLGNYNATGRGFFCIYSIRDIYLGDGNPHEYFYHIL